MRTGWILTGLLALAGCVSPPTGSGLVAPPEQAQALQRSIAECQYEIALAVREPAGVSRHSLLSDYALAKEREAMLLPCLHAKGWALQ